jgi:hypothetical protein
MQPDTVLGHLSLFSAFVMQRSHALPVSGGVWAAEQKSVLPHSALQAEPHAQAFTRLARLDAPSKFPRAQHEPQFDSAAHAPASPKEAEPPPSGPLPCPVALPPLWQSIEIVSVPETVAPLALSEKLPESVPVMVFAESVNVPDSPVILMPSVVVHDCPGSTVAALPETVSFVGQGSVGESALMIALPPADVNWVVCTFDSLFGALPEGVTVALSVHVQVPTHGAASAEGGAVLPPLSLPHCTESNPVTPVRIAHSAQRLRRVWENVAAARVPPLSIQLRPSFRRHTTASESRFGRAGDFRALTPSRPRSET